MTVPGRFWVVVSAIILASCSNPPYPRGAAESLFPQGRLPVMDSVAADEDGARIHFAKVGGSGPPSIMFVHGTPGDWKAFAAYLDRDDLRATGPLLATDRPGFGTSNKFQSVPDFSRQVELHSGFLGPPSSPTLVVGHSYGGAIAARLALDFPDRVRGALLIAPSIATPLESPRWYNRLADYRLVQWLLPRELVLSNRELMPLQGELAKMDPLWPQLRRPVWVLQGMRDKLVDPRTSEFAEARIPSEWGRVIRMKDEGHFVIWDRPDLVAGLILEMWAL